MSKVKTGKYSNFRERNRKSQGYLLKKLLMDYGLAFCRFLLLFGMCFLILQPILNKISVSFMSEPDLYNPVVISIPENFTTENYKLAAELMSYKETLVNSLIVSLTIAVLQITVCTLVGYGFARFKFPFKKFWFSCVMLVILIPPQTISSSLHLHFRYFDVLGLFKLIKGETINLRGSALPYYLMSAGCMGLKNGLYIYMIRQFFRNIPKELEEAENIYQNHASGSQADPYLLLSVFVCMAVDRWFLFQNVSGEYQITQHLTCETFRFPGGIHSANHRLCNNSCGSL